jgi:hypothetical protein
VVGLADNTDQGSHVVQNIISKNATASELSQLFIKLNERESI